MPMQNIFNCEWHSIIEPNLPVENILLMLALLLMLIVFQRQHRLVPVMTERPHVCHLLLDITAQTTQFVAFALDVAGVNIQCESKMSPPPAKKTV